MSLTSRRGGSKGSYKKEGGEDRETHTVDFGTGVACNMVLKRVAKSYQRELDLDGLLQWSEVILCNALSNKSTPSILGQDALEGLPCSGAYRK